MRSVSALFLLTCSAGWASAQEEFTMPDAPGPFIHPSADALAEATSFSADAAIVGTYYFYWYDIYSRAHFVNGDGSDALVDHPVSTEDFSYKSPRWHEKELRDVIAANLDFILPVFWGSPDDYQSWSFVGLPPLVQAWEKLDKEGADPPKIGLFYDTSTLRHNPSGTHVDLTTEGGKLWLYATIRDFFSLIPPKAWFMIDDRPVVWLYSAAFAKQQSPDAFDFVRRRFKEDFGREPYIVKERSWRAPADNVYAWGAALSPQFLGVAALGPGYDHHAVPGRTPLVRDREDGAFYARSWRALLARKLRRRSNIAIVETWNELHEGTDICETREYGRKYIELTAMYARMFKDRVVLPPTGPYADADTVSIDLDVDDGANGIALRDAADGPTETAKVAGRICRRTVNNEHGDVRYLYFDLDDSFAFDEEGLDLLVKVDYYDDGCRGFGLQYDSNDPESSVREGAFKGAADEVLINGRGRWLTAEFRLSGGRFANRANGADFRLYVTGGDLAVARVTAKKL